MPSTGFVRTARRRDAVGYFQSLATRRRWFADADGAGAAGGEPDKTDNKPGAPDEDGGGGGDIAALPSWAQGYIGELRDEAKQRRIDLRKMQDEMTSIKKQMSAAAQNALAEQGNFKELAEQRAQMLAELEPFKDRAESLEKMIRSSNEARVAQIPETMRPLVPGEYSPEKLAAWLDANLSRLTTPTAPNLDGGAGGSSGMALTPEQKQMARRMGMTDEQYAAALKKAGGA